MKKITAFLSALVLLTSMFSLCASAGEYLYGDVDMNGKIDILDVITLNKAILGKEFLSKEASALADVDGDSMPTSTDALQIMKYIVGLITEFENSAVIQPEIIQDAKIYNNHRYQLFDIGMTWTEAKAYCENLGGHLMTISSPEETDTVLNIFSQSSKQLLWLGGYYDEEASGWKWVDDSEFDYTNWDDYAPDRQTRNDQTEAYMMTYKKPNPNGSNSEAYKWNDIFEDGCFPGEEDFFSTENYCFICEWDDIEDSYIEYNTHRYQLFEQSMTWTEAKAYCENLGGHLMTVSSAEETDTVLEIFSKSQKLLLWLGGYYDEETSGWKWVDDSEFDYTNWDDYAPDRQTRNDQTEAYMMTYKKPNPSSGISHSEAYKWNDIFENGCFPGEEDFFSTENYCFICEWDS